MNPRKSLQMSSAQNRLAELSFSLSVIEKKASQCAKAAKGFSWGLLGSTVGYALGSMWVHKDSHFFLSSGQVSGIGYCLFVAAYAIFQKSYFATSRCLNKAKLLFIADQVTENEYNRMRGKCLKTGGLV